VDAAAKLPAPTLCNTTGAAPDPGWRYRSFEVVVLEPGVDGFFPYFTGPLEPSAILVDKAMTELFVLSSPVDRDATPVESAVTALVVVLMPVDRETIELL
jgi:hypothetical protein